MGELVDLAGAFDLHVHSYPSLFPRLSDDFQLADAYGAAGFGGFVLKGHHESTASRAYLVGRMFPDLRVFGGIVLNRFVGGLNPSAVEACLRTGGRVVWMPSIDADGHAQAYGATGGYDAQQSGLRGEPRGLTIFDDRGQVVDAVIDILDLVREAGAILATAHLSAPEVLALVPIALERGLEKVVITHPFFKVPAFDLDTLASLISERVYAEFAYNTLSPMWQHTTVDRVREAIGRIGARQCLLVSDGGQRHNPSPPEGLRVFAQSLFERGVCAEEIVQMTRTNQRMLLNLNEAP
ncbi:MAG: DUF6282 family protein [Chloroflexota bacterium]|nr:DUF6282 family protein [Chloroflexota bacterium]